MYTLIGEEMVQYAEDHRAVIRRFGRFPRRNAAPAHTGTREELDYLAQPDCTFSLPESCRAMKNRLALKLTEQAALHRYGA